MRRWHLQSIQLRLDSPDSNIVKGTDYGHVNALNVCKDNQTSVETCEIVVDACCIRHNCPPFNPGL